MKVPERIPGLKLLLIIVSVYAVIWISLEGNLLQVLLLSAGTVLIIAAYLIQRLLAGRTLGLAQWLAICAGGGLFLSLIFGALTVTFMAIKTGLHGHGPEFSPDEISWVVGQMPFWIVLGLLVGAGLGALVAGFSGRES